MFEPLFFGRKIIRDVFSLVVVGLRVTWRVDLDLSASRGLCSIIWVGTVKVLMKKIMVMEVRQDNCSILVLAFLPLLSITNFAIFL